MTGSLIFELWANFLALLGKSITNAIFRSRVLENEFRKRNTACEKMIIMNMRKLCQKQMEFYKKWPKKLIFVSRWNMKSFLGVKLMFYAWNFVWMNNTAKRCTVLARIYVSSLRINNFTEIEISIRKISSLKPKLWKLIL